MIFQNQTTHKRSHKRAKENIQITADLFHHSKGQDLSLIDTEYKEQLWESAEEKTTANLEDHKGS